MQVNVSIPCLRPCKSMWHVPPGACHCLCLFALLYFLCPCLAEAMQVCVACASRCMSLVALVCFVVLYVGILVALGSFT